MNLPATFPPSPHGSAHLSTGADPIAAATPSIRGTVTTTTATPQAVSTDDPRMSDSRPPGGAASGDLNGDYPNPTVTGIQGYPVQHAAPSDGQALIWNTANGRYQPGIPSGSGCAIHGGTAYYMPFPIAGSAGSIAAFSNGGVNHLKLMLITPTCTVTFNSISVNITSASGTGCPGGTCGLLFGIYDAAGSLLSSSVVAVSGGTPDINTTGWIQILWQTPQTLMAGTPYYLASTSDSASLFLATTNSWDLGPALNVSGNIGVGGAGNPATGGGATLGLPLTTGPMTSAAGGYGTVFETILR